MIWSRAQRTLLGQTLFLTSKSPQHLDVRVPDGPSLLPMRSSSSPSIKQAWQSTPFSDQGIDILHSLLRTKLDHQVRFPAVTSRVSGKVLHLPGRQRYTSITATCHFILDICLASLYSAPVLLTVLPCSIKPNHGRNGVVRQDPPSSHR